MWCFLIFALALCAAPLRAAELKPFTASYTSERRYMLLGGKAERSLRVAADGLWTLNISAGILLASASETSTFRCDNERCVPLTYRYGRKGFGRNREGAYAFDWARMQAEGHDRGAPVRLPLKAGLLDRSTCQYALQLDVASGKTNMSYQVVVGSRVETVAFQVVGQERVQTAVGMIDAIKVERVRGSASVTRQTTLWLAKDWDCLLVRLRQVEKDGREYLITLKEGSVAGRPVVGRTAPD